MRSYVHTVAGDDHAEACVRVSDTGGLRLGVESTLLHVLVGSTGDPGTPTPVFQTDT